MHALFLTLLCSRNGATAIEYGLIAALISVVVIVALSLVGTNLSAVFESIATQLGATQPAAPPPAG